MKAIPARMVTVLIVVLLLPGVACAIDSRFELDLRTLDRRPATPAGGQGKSAEEVRPAGKSAKMHSRKSAKKGRSTHRHALKETASAEEARYGLQLVGAPKPGGEEGLGLVEQIWDELLPGSQTSHEVDLETGQFMLSLDPKKYPVYPAADGGRILIDRERSMPPLVKSLLTQNEPDIRIVAENPADAPNFIRAMLNAAGFYSLEENFDCGFGEDPKLLVHADYKIERGADSLLAHDMILLNVGRHRSRMPDSLTAFLKNKGFQVIEPALPRPGAKVEGLGEIFQVVAKEPEKIADSLMDALSIRFERNRNVTLSGFSGQGIDLKIRADRYFEAKGREFVVSYFNGDPVSYTLTRLMETNGYRVIILDGNDNLQTISQKFNSRLQLNGEYGIHKLWDSGALPYGIEMSGMMMHDTTGRKTVVLTNRSFDPLTRELAELNGYAVLTY